MKDYSLIPKTYTELIEIAKLQKKTPKFLPQDKQSYSIEELAKVISTGLDIGLNVTQALEGILYINGKFSVWGDILVGMAWGSGKLVDLEEKTSGDYPEDNYTAICTTKRTVSDGNIATITRSFSISDAKKAGLWQRNPIWKKYPKRMLNMRARSWALRDGFSDVLRGLVAVEEAVDYEGHPDYKKSQEFVSQAMEGNTSKKENKKEARKNSTEISPIEILGNIDDKLEDFVLKTSRDFLENPYENINITKSLLKAAGMVEIKANEEDSSDLDAIKRHIEDVSYVQIVSAKFIKNTQAYLGYLVKEKGQNEHALQERALLNPNGLVEKVAEYLENSDA